eukprot:scaffold37922_cov281-Isochrysis_galbana.AAC.1
MSSASNGSAWWTPSSCEPAAHLELGQHPARWQRPLPDTTRRSGRRVREGAVAVDSARLGRVEAHAALAVLLVLVQDVPRPEHRPHFVRDRRVVLRLVVVGRGESPLRNPDALQ